MIRSYNRGTTVSANFKADEFICKCAACQTKGVAYLDDALTAKLQAFRLHIGKPITITSGNRCAARNTAINGAKDSRHLTPKYSDGVDIRVSSIVPDDLAIMAEAFGFNGVGVYSAGNNYIHVDTRPGAHTCWWLKTSGSNTPGFGGIPCVFKSGHRSPAVTKIQAALHKAGFMTKKPDGKGTMDAATVAALKAFQKANDLTPDGVFGKGTNATLKVFPW